MRFKNNLPLILLAVILLVACSIAQAQIKVACIGNSVTRGYGLKDPLKESYPAQLQGLLGKKYAVQNFGFSGATLLRKGHRPYDKTKEFTEALAYKPDIAVVHLGLNDTDPRNWPDYKDNFEADYAWLLDTLKKQNPKMKVYVCRLTPIFNGHPRFKSGTRDWYWQIQDRLSNIAEANAAQLIDLTTALHNRPDLFADNLHPDAEGTTIIAKTVYGYLSGNYGGLSLPMIFSDHMVMQRNQTIPVYGTADAGESVAVTFNANTQKTKADASGKWSVRFPAMANGGPLQLEVRAKSRKIVLKDILIGDVWVCAGQSNMAFQFRSAATGKQELQDMPQQSQLRLFKMNQLAETDNRPWDTTTLQRTNGLEFFSGQWKETNATSAADFSAIGYYFGKKISADVNVPVGLIDVAVGGSTMESWIDRYTMEHDPVLVDVLYNWRKSDFVQEWVRGRADVNLEKASNAKQRHPYEPVYNYEAALSKLINSPIAGVIWYQGESNTHNVELYEYGLPVLVSSWRKNWGLNFPFYYVQLSGIDRPSWPYFRDAQRKLLDLIPNSGMAVSYDLGDSLNVHPIRKKELGERLALQALKQTYGKELVASGPEPLSATIQQGNIVISFKPSAPLAVANRGQLTGFELVTFRGNHLTAQARLVNNQVLLALPSGEKIKTVLYAWQPFTRANLINEAGLPASTFSIPLN